MWTWSCACVYLWVTEAGFLTLVGFVHMCRDWLAVGQSSTALAGTTGAIKLYSIYHFFVIG